MGRYSHSRLSTFEQCPQKYKFQYIDNIEVEEATTVEAFMGSLVHQVLEKLYRDLSFGKVNSREELLEYYRGLWDSLWDDESIVIVRQEYSAADYKRRGAQLILNYYAANEPFTDAKTLGIETEHLLDLENGHQYHVRMDRFTKTADGVYEVHDFKTSSSMKSQEELDEDRQLAMYSLWVKRNFADAQKVRLVWHYLAFGKRMESERSDEELESLKSDVVKRIEQVESAKEFHPKPSALCGWCVFQSLCPAFAKESEGVDDKAKRGIALVDSYARLVDARNALDVDIAKIQDALLKFTAEQGLTHVYGSAKKVSILPLHLAKVSNEREVMMLLLKAGLYSEFATLDVQKLSKAVDSGVLPEDVRESLVKLLEREQSTEVKLSRKNTLV